MHRHVGGGEAISGEFFFPRLEWCILSLLFYKLRHGQSAGRTVNAGREIHRILNLVRGSENNLYLRALCNLI